MIWNYRMSNAYSSELIIIFFLDVSLRFSIYSPRRSHFELNKFFSVYTSLKRFECYICKHATIS